MDILSVLADRGGGGGKGANSNEMVPIVGFFHYSLPEVGTRYNFSWFAIDGSITFFLLFDFDKSRFLGI
jgi:hypothetical protein